MAWEALEARGVARSTLDPALIALPASCPVAVLGVHLGDALVLSQECDNWYLARHANLPGQFGLLPKAYVAVVGRGKEEEEDVEDVEDVEDDELVEEMTRSLREWHVLLKSHLFPSADVELVSLVPALMREIMTARSQLILFNMINAGSGEERGELRDKVAIKLDFLNRRLALDLKVRDHKHRKRKDNVATPILLYKQFKCATEKLSSAMLVQPKMPTTATTATSITTTTMMSSSHSNLNGVHALNLANGLSHTNERSLRRSTLVTSMESNFSITLTIKELLLNQTTDASLTWNVSVYEIGVDGSYRQLCENFVVQEALVAKNTNMGYQESRKTTYPSVVFSALSKSDVSSKRLYIVAHGMTKGVFGKHDLRNVERTLFFKKNFGIAAVEISDLFTFRQEQKHNSALSASFVFSPMSEPFDATLKRLVVNDKKSSSSSSLNNNNGELRMDISIRLVDSNELQSSKRGSTNGLNPQDDLVVARRIGLPEVVLPSEVRNELYVTLCHGEFSRLEKRSDRNVEVTIEVCSNESGLPRPKSISVGVQSSDKTKTKDGGGVDDSLQDEFVSTVLYHECRPRWNELLKVVLPVDLFSESHLRLTFRHRSSNLNSSSNGSGNRGDPWAFAFLKLINDIDKTTVRDGLHDLLVYRVDNNRATLKVASNSAPSYLEVPYLRSSQFQLRQKHSTHVLGLSLLSKDSVCLKTSLCSTKLTQNEGLLKLLQWRDEMESLEENLRIFNQKVSGQELVKFLPDVLDALFAMLTEASFSVECDALVFRTLLQVLHIVTEDSKFVNFLPVLELYVQENYSATLAYNKLLVMLKECVVDRALRPREVLQAMRSLNYVLKFVARSRMLFATLNANKGKEPFDELLRSLLESLLHLMCSESPECLQAQSLCLRNLVHSIEDLMTVFDSEQLSAMIVRIIGVMAEDRLVEQRLSALKEIVASKLFTNTQCRAIIMPEICRAVSNVLSRDLDDPDDSRLSLANAILSDLLIALGSVDSATASGTKQNVVRARELMIAQDISTLMTSSLRPLIQCIINRRRQSAEMIADLVANLIALLNALSKAHFVNYINSYISTNHCKGQRYFDLVDFLQELLSLFTDLISKSVFPTDWAAFLLLQNATILKVQSWLAETVVDFLKEPFEHQVWSSVFACGITLATDGSLQLENFSEYKRESILKEHGDMRESIAKLLRSLWFSLGHQKINFLTELIGPLLRLTLVPQSELRKMMLPIFFDMMQTEFYSHKKSVSISSLESESNGGRTVVKGNFDGLKNHLMTHLDELIQNENLGDVHFKFLFKHQLSTLIESHTALKTIGKHFISLVGRQLELLLESRALNNEYREEEDEELKRMSLWQLSLFYTDEARIEDLRVKYIRRLVESHKKSANWAEAAVATLYLADDENSLNEALNLFERGKMFERALEVCEKLIKLHKKKAFDFDKLSEVHQKMAELYAAIVNRDTLRHHPEYFRVAFYGRAFPFFLQNKVFVFRGRPLERLGDFQSRLSDSFPLAELLRTLDPPELSVREKPVQLLQINRVEPLVTKESIRHLIELSNGERARRRIVDYYRANEVDTFVYSRPFTKKEESSNEFGNLWLERTSLKTTSLFPGPLLFFPLKDKEVSEEISPLTHALESMKKSNEEVRVLILEHAEAPFPALNSLSMKLNGIIDAAVMGGTANYEKAFFNDEYLNTRPEDASKVEALKNLIADQIPLLETGLKIHQCRMSDDLRPLHERLETMFATMRSHVEERYGRRTCDISVSVKRGSNARLRKSSAGSVESITQLRRSQFYTSMDASELMDVSSSTPPSTKLRGGSGVLSAIGLSRSSKHKSSSSSIRNSSDETMLDENNEDMNNSSLLSVTCNRRSRSPSIASSGTNESNTTWKLAESSSTIVPPPIPPKIRNDVNNLDGISIASNSSSNSFIVEESNNSNNVVHHNIVLSGKKRAPPPPPLQPPEQ